MRVTASKAVTARNKRGDAPTLNGDLVSHANGPTGDLSTTMDVADAEHAAQTRQTCLSRQQEADACIEYWNEVFAVEGSFADEYAIL
ncbi:MAG TPA: type II toxin-antitoxin system CcdA family antitoxin [Casimicrobium sp.]|nr:type II toxin-antitoxin system CcdA family antitoxin [Casimicrobium sp.]